MRDKDLTSALTELLKSQTDDPALILLDHFLREAISGNNDILPTGVIAAVYLRQKWPRCPIVCITADMNEGKNNFDKYTFETCAYNEIVLEQNFSKSVSFFPSLIDGFEKLAQISDVNKPIANKPTIEKIKPLLFTDHTDDEDEQIWHQILSTFPESVTQDINKDLFSCRFYNWYRDSFFKTPGFLYDKKWLATFLGIKWDNNDSNVIDSYIKKNKAIFDSCQYKGVFQNENSPRWWRHKWENYIFSQPYDNLRTPQEISVKCFGIAESDKSTCHHSEKKLPDTMAYIDEQSKDLVQVFRRFTQLHPQKPIEPYYEEARYISSE